MESRATLLFKLFDLKLKANGDYIRQYPKIRDNKENKRYCCDVRQ